MDAGELATFTALGLPIVICVLVDDSLSLIEIKQRSSQRPNLGVNFGGPGLGTDFVGLARAFGGHDVAVADPAALAEAAKAALTHDRFTLIAGQIPRRAYDGAFEAQAVRASQGLSHVTVKRAARKAWPATFPGVWPTDR